MDSPRVSFSATWACLVPGPYQPSASTPRTVWSSTAAGLGPHTYAAVRPSTSSTGTMVVVVVVAGNVVTTTGTLVVVVAGAAVVVDAGGSVAIAMVGGAEVGEADGG